MTKDKEARNPCLCQCLSYFLDLWAFLFALWPTRSQDQPFSSPFILLISRFLFSFCYFKECLFFHCVCGFLLFIEDFRAPREIDHPCFFVDSLCFGPKSGEIYANSQIWTEIKVREAPDTFNFLKHVMRAIWSVRPKCSHRCVSLKETPLKPVQSLKHSTENSAEQTVMRTKWFKHIAI